MMMMMMVGLMGLRLHSAMENVLLLLLVVVMLLVLLVLLVV